MKKVTGCSLLFVLLIAYSAIGQISFHPVKNTQKAKPNASARTAENTLNLPVWDDFSQTNQVPNSLIWQNSEDVFISPGMGLQPPSLNVASLDGLKGDGSPYSALIDAEGMTDSLSTCPIDLSLNSTSDNIYVSFFYQYAGLGEQPEIKDSIRVEFLNENLEWVNVWPGNAGNLDRSGNFIQVLLPVNDPQYLHNQFRVKFQSFGRQSGPFDTWNIDYFYINEGRSASDNSYPDRAITNPPTSMLNGYSAIPRTHFNAIFNDPFFTLTNVDIDDAPQPYDFDYTYSVTHFKDGTNLGSSAYTVNNAEPLTPSTGSPVFPGAVDSVFVPNNIPATEFDVLADSSFIDLDIKLNSDDNIDPEPIAQVLDFTVNDFTNRRYVLSDYYAYDDGTAEVGVSVNFSRNRVAHQFEKQGDTLNYLIAFDIYFPYVNESPNGKRVDLMAWTDSNGKPGNILLEEEVTISALPGLNTFTRFKLQNPVLIRDPLFFVGYRQLSNGYLSVGFDRNTNNQDKTFFNLSGAWEANDVVSGSLMIRPVFGPEPEVFTGLPDPEDAAIRIYPNPTEELLTFSTRIKQAEIYGMDGRKYSAPMIDEGSLTILDLKALPKGIYLIKFVANNQVFSKKVIKK